MSNIDYELIDPDMVELVKTLNQLPEPIAIWGCFAHYGARMEIDLWCRDVRAVNKLKGAFEGQIRPFSIRVSLRHSRFFIEGTDEEKRYK